MITDNLMLLAMSPISPSWVECSPGHALPDIARAGSRRLF
jgi:hypothetical protein